MNTTFNEQGKALATRLQEVLSQPEKVLGAEGMAQLRALLCATVAYDTISAALARGSSPEVVELLRTEFEAVLASGTGLRQLIEDSARRMQTANDVGIVFFAESSLASRLTDICIDLARLLVGIKLDALREHGIEAAPVDASTTDASTTDAVAPKKRSAPPVPTVSESLFGWLVPERGKPEESTADTTAASDPSSTEAAPTDASPTDAAPTDASPTDAAPTDASPAASPTDAAPTDASPTDAVSRDVSLADAEPGGVSPADAAPVDASADPTEPEESTAKATAASVAARLGELDPALVQGSEDEVAGAVMEQLETARDFGFASEADLSRYANLSLTMGPSFPEAPQFDWAMQILADTSLEPAAKMDRLWQTAADVYSLEADHSSADTGT